MRWTQGMTQAARMIQILARENANAPSERLREPIFTIMRECAGCQSSVLGGDLRFVRYANAGAGGSTTRPEMIHGGYTPTPRWSVVTLDNITGLDSRDRVTMSFSHSESVSKRRDPASHRAKRRRLIQLNRRHPRWRHPLSNYTSAAPSPRSSRDAASPAQSTRSARPSGRVAVQGGVRRRRSWLRMRALVGDAMPAREGGAAGCPGDVRVAVRLPHRTSILQKTASAQGLPVGERTGQSSAPRVAVELALDHTGADEHVLRGVERAVEHALIAAASPKGRNAPTGQGHPTQEAGMRPRNGDATVHTAGRYRAGRDRRGVWSMKRKSCCYGHCSRTPRVMQSCSREMPMEHCRYWTTVGTAPGASSLKPN
ncbi:hypothetical protein B0H11DRAFT_1940306 [Mycena galericulata]|nr:hypothetical protein B0H11DRAFT_1940306 [Mycena galericulata]